MSVEDFWNSDVRDIRNVINGAVDRNQGLIRNQWDTTRWQTTYLLNIQMDKKHRISSPKELIQFPWDTDHKQTEEEWQEELARREAANKIFAKWDAAKAQKQEEEE